MEIAQTIADSVLDNVRKVIVGKDNEIRLTLVALLCEGHLLIEDVAGVGKAMLAFMDADEQEQILRMQSFHRFTPTTLASEAVMRQSLERTRSRGYAYDREEHEAGVICVAMPILSDEGRVLGAVSLTGSTLRTDLKTLEAHVPRLRQCVEAIAIEASHWAFPVEGHTETEGRLG